MSRSRSLRRRVSIWVALSWTPACAVGGDGGGGVPVSRQAVGCVPLEGTGRQVDSAALTENVRAGRTYDCVLRAGSSPLRVTLVADSAANTISRIELRRRSESSPFQTLTEAQVEPPYRGADFFSARDLDGDTYLDLLLLSEWGVTGNNFYHVWRWNSAAERFAFDSTLSAIASPTPVAGRPCVTTRSNGGRAGMIYTAATLCLERRKWVRVARDDQEWDERARAYVRTVREQRGDSLAVTRVDTVRDSTGQ